jgi:hypothetical protein
VGGEEVTILFFSPIIKAKEFFFLFIIYLLLVWDKSLTRFIVPIPHSSQEDGAGWIQPICDFHSFDCGFFVFFEG